MSAETVIVTGASRGLGAATAANLGQIGANVVLNARSEQDLQELAAHIDPAGERVLVVSGDVTNPADCERLVDQTISRFGQLDAIINNAGVLQPIAAIGDADPAAWRLNIDVNLIGPFYLVHYALPHLRLQRGRVINVSSGAAVRATEGWSAYCAAKAGLNLFTEVLAAEEKDVVAIAFRPGVVDTAMQQAIREEGGQGMRPESHRRFVHYHQQGELLPPEVPGRALAVLSLHAPLEWSGAFMSWDDAQVQNLVAKHH